MQPNILIADDDVGVLSALKMLLKTEGFATTSTNSPESALAALKKQNYSLAIIDLNYSLDTTSGEEGIELISAIRKHDELIPIIVMTGWGTIEIAVEAIRNGANDFIQKPWENERLLSIINNQLKLASSQQQSQKLSQQNQLLREQLGCDTEIIACSESIKQALQILKKVANSDVSVLLTGENGTGKSMFANYIHNQSKRNQSALVSVNMGAVTESLFESEMFGHTKGAFTDAKSSRIGRFELADNGTLFLDEIANTPYSQQAKLLRVLEDSQFEKVGSSRTQSVNIRLITATNADLNQAVEEGTFRKDLLYRINTIEVEIPPLRERIEDILPLANAFLEKVATKYSQSKLQISKTAAAALQSYQWPGNVRELGHVIERAQILCQNDTIEVDDLGLTPTKVSTESQPNQATAENDLRTMQAIESDIISKRLNYFDGNARKAAESLGLSRSAFYRRLEKN